MDNRLNRAAIAQQTLVILEQGYYLNSQGVQVSIAAQQAHAQTNSRRYRGEELATLSAQTVPEARFNTRFEVRNESTLAGSRRLLDEGFDQVACLNFASAKNPGGGFLGGAEAQEENLAKSSGLYPCLAQMSAMYEGNRRLSNCLYSDDMIYSPAVPVFRDDSYALLDEAVCVSMITSPAVNRGALARNDPHLLNLVDEVMQVRIDKLLTLAYAQGHRVLVLGAWGCGVFANDPAQMAQRFANALVQGRWSGVFEKVSFSVLEKKEKGCFTAFERIFA